MKNDTDNHLRGGYASIWLLTMVLVGALGWHTVLGDPSGKVHELPYLLPVLAQEVEQKIDRLAICESGGKASAINPVDRDGTPSNGKYQFKRDTWKLYVKRYGLWEWQTWSEEKWEETLFSGFHQDVVVRLMFVDSAVNLQNEFPACSKLLGLAKNYALSEQE